VPAATDDFIVAACAVISAGACPCDEGEAGIGVVNGSAAERLEAVEWRDRVAEAGNREARDARERHLRQIMAVLIR